MGVNKSGRSGVVSHQQLYLFSPLTYEQVHTSHFEEGNLIYLSQDGLSELLYIHIYTFVYVYTKIYVCIYENIYKEVYSNIHIYVFKYTAYMHVSMHIHSYERMEETLAYT